MDGMTPTELAERIEREGASRELDAEIAVTVLGMDREGNLFESADRTYVLERDYYDLEGNPRELPAYTTSLDAAMSLLNGWAYVAKRHLLHRVLARIDKDNLDAAEYMARLICIEALPALRANMEDDDA